MLGGITELPAKQLFIVNLNTNFIELAKLVIIPTYNEKENIEARNIWKPMHLQPVFSHCNTIAGRVSEQLFETGICLPSGAAMNQQNQARVIKVIKKAFNKAC